MLSSSDLIMKTESFNYKNSPFDVSSLENEIIKKQNMNKIKFLTVVFCLLSSIVLIAQKIDYTTRWLGNTYGGAI